MLINGQEGVLSVGGTTASAIKMVVSQTESELETLGAVERGEAKPSFKSQHLEKRGRASKDVMPRQADWEEGWVWSKVQGAEGWWQMLMQSAWVDGSRVLQNQAAVVDVRICESQELKISLTSRR